MADQPEMVPVPTTTVPDPPEVTPVSPMVLWSSESAQGTTETRSLNRFSVFTCFLFFLETVGYLTLLVNLVVFLCLYLRLSYKLGTDHFWVEEVLWPLCAFTI